MIPSQVEMFRFVLEVMADHSEFSRRQAKDLVCEKLDLSDEEKAQHTSSGVPVYESRVGWAVSWLSDAGYLTRVRRGVYSITDEGKKHLTRIF